MTPDMEDAADEIERLRVRVAELENECNRWADGSIRQDVKLNRLRSVLASLLKDPPSTLDEPDTDAEVIQKMRAIVREALA